MLDTATIEPKHDGESDGLAEATLDAYSRIVAGDGDPVLTTYPPGHPARQ